MKNFCFIVSHFYSGSFDLIEILNDNSRCSFKTGSEDFIYNHPEILDPIINKKNIIFGDHILKNYNLSCTRFYEFAKFIYVIRSPRQTFNDFIFNNSNKNIESFSSYYRFRLRRICEMAKKTPGALLLNWEDLKNKKAFPLIENYLNIKNINYNGNYFQTIKDNFENETLIKEANKSYERYHYFLNNLKSISKV